MGDKPRFSGIVFGIGDFDEIDHEAAMGTEIDFGPGFEEVYARAVTAAREHKEEAVVNGPMDLTDQCVVYLPQGCFLCPIRTICDGMGINPPEAIALSMEILRKPMGVPIAVMVLIETVFRVQQGTMRKPERGEIAEAWHAGTDINIKEALTVIVATPHRLAIEFMPYHYGSGSVVWDVGNRNDVLSEQGWPDIEVDDGTGVAEAVRTAFSKEGGGDGAF